MFLLQMVGEFARIGHAKHQTIMTGRKNFFIV